MKFFLEYVETGCAILNIPVDVMHREMKATTDALITASEASCLSTEKFLEAILVRNEETRFRVPKGALESSRQHIDLDETLAPILNGSGIPNWNIIENLRPNRHTVYSVPQTDYQRREISYFLFFNIMSFS
jgi:hypothetical protein